MGKTIPLLIGLFVLTVFLSGAGTVCLAKDQPPFTADELDLFLYDYQAHLVQEQSEDATEGVYPSDPTYRNERYQYIKNRIETVRSGGAIPGHAGLYTGQPGYSGGTKGVQLGYDQRGR